MTAYDRRVAGREMKALVWHGTRSVAYEDAPEPEPGGGEVVLDVELAGICGSDLHGYRGHPGPRVPPLVLGHEVVGRVDGDAYAVYPLIGCGECEHCLAGEDNHCASWRLIGMHRPGVFAERVAVPRKSLVPLPDGIDHERAVLVEPLACCVGALAPHGDAQFVAVLGCGPLGLLTVYLARARGRARDRRRPALRAARDRRAARRGRHRGRARAGRLRPRRRRRRVRGRPGAPALAGVRAGGTVVMLGLGNAEATFPMAVLVRRAMTCAASSPTRAPSSRARSRCSPRATSPLDWLSTAPLSEGAEAFANLVDRPAEYAKVVLHRDPWLVTLSLGGRAVSEPRSSSPARTAASARGSPPSSSPTGGPSSPSTSRPSRGGCGCCSTRTRSRRSRTSPATSPTSARSSARSTSTRSRT